MTGESRLGKKPASLSKPLRNRIIGHGAELVDQMLANPLNFRLHPDNQQQALAGAIDDIGFIRSVTVNQRTGRVVDGHLRVTIAARSGVESLPVEYVDLTEAEEAQALLSIDPIAAMAASDKAKLDELMRAVQSDDARVQEMMADLAEREGLEYGKADPQEDPGAQVDRAEELREKWGLETGQLWQLGEHRLICGDCTDKAVVERVMGGESAQICFTSPPYAAQRDYEIGDFDWDALMLGMSEQAISVVHESGAILINLGLVHRDRRVVRYWDQWLDWMDNTNFPLFDWYVWDKINGLMGDWRGRLAPAHEWIFHFANKPRGANKTEKTKYAENGVTHYKKNKVGLREKDGKLKGFTQAGQTVSNTKIPDSVIRCQPARGGVEGHPAPFSTDFAAFFVETFANPGEIVYEPFCGSGTTIIACEALNRKCRSIDLEPKYVAVALQRWADMTGGVPELITT